MSETNTDTIVRIAGFLVVLGLVAPFVVTGVPAVVGAEESYVVLSGSMAADPEPVIKPGDVVIVNSVDGDALGEGDIITFDRGGDTPTTHRIVAVKQQDGQRQFVTKGDNNEDADSQPVMPDQVIGRVMLTLPLVGHVVQFANTTLGFATLVGVPIGLLVLSEAWNLARDPGRDVLGGGSEDDGGPDGSDPEPAATNEASSDLLDADETVTLGEAQLKVALAVLAPVIAASGVAAYRLQTAWALTLLYASLGLFVLGGGLYLRLTGGLVAADADDDAATDEAAETAATTATATAPAAAGTDDGAAEARVVTGRVRDSFDGDARVVVDVPEREELLAVARDRGRHAIEHPSTGTLHLVCDQTVFRCATDGSTTSDEAGDPDERDTRAIFNQETRDTATDGGAGTSASMSDTTADVIVDPTTNIEGDSHASDDPDEWVAAVERVVAEESRTDAESTEDQ